jgi:SnoaL-like domain
MTSTDTSLLVTISAERAIYRTFFHYFWLVDHRQWERVAGECFAPDAVVTLEGGPSTVSLHGRSEIHDFYRDEWGEQNPDRLEHMAHVAGQHIIDWKEGVPVLRASVTGWRWYHANASLGAQREADRAVLVFSDDEFAEVGGQWLIQDRKVHYHATAVERMPVP